MGAFYVDRKGFLLAWQRAPHRAWAVVLHDCSPDANGNGNNKRKRTHPKIHPSCPLRSEFATKGGRYALCFDVQDKLHTVEL